MCIGLADILGARVIGGVIGTLGARVCVLVFVETFKGGGIGTSVFVETWLVVTSTNVSSFNTSLLTKTFVLLDLQGNVSERFARDFKTELKLNQEK